MYLDTPFYTIMESFVPMPGGIIKFSDEHFIKDTYDLVKTAVEKAEAEVTENHRIAGPQKKKEVILLLHQRGIFRLKNAIDIVADCLGLSKNTVYLHLRNIQT
jgi:predicted transcriptional regulator YheO